MTMIVRKVIGDMAWGHWIPNDRWRVEMIIFIIIMVLGHVLIRMRLPRHNRLVKILLVKVSPYRLGVIRIERQLSKIWIIIKVRNFVVRIHIIKNC